MSFPVKYGIYSEIETKDVIFQFNLNNEIIKAQGKDKTWIHPLEWLKRTMGNDWIYYSSGGYTGVVETIGEYYLPNLQYPTNSLLGGKPFKTESVDRIVSSWHEILQAIPGPGNGLNGKFKIFMDNIRKISPGILKTKAENLFSTPEESVTVLPPDARHVDYDVIPLNISTGCLYKCKFCRVKTGNDFKEKKKADIKKDISRLKKLYDKDIINYNSLFLGQHDALNADMELILFAAKEAYSAFGFENSYIKGSSLFLFGSVDSLLNADHTLFAKLNQLNFQTYINIGLESADQKTLDFIGKPITTARVKQAFKTILHINSLYDNIEITSNFLMDDNLPKGHYPAFLKLARKSVAKVQTKGCIYLSPLSINRPSREEIFKFNRLKILSRFPTFLYIIQRL